MAESREPRAESALRSGSGFALVAALWLVVAIAAVAFEVAIAARDRRLSAANALEEEQARAAAASGVEHARERLVRELERPGLTGRRSRLSALGSRQPDPERRTADPGSLDPWHDLDRVLPDSVALGQGWYRVRLADLGARLNVDRASEEELRRFLAAHRVDADQADALAQAIADWRDADDRPRVHGAERADYLRAGAAELPRDGPFESVDELRHVRGMTPALLDRIRDELTVDGDGRIDVNTAPRAVLLALPGFGEQGVDAILAARGARHHIAGFEELSVILPPAARDAMEREAVSLLPRLTFVTRTVEVTSEGWVAGSPVRVRVTATIVNGGRTAFVTWRRTIT